MAICPRCEQPVDETTRTTCPVCFTPLGPQANAEQAPSTSASPLYQSNQQQSGAQSRALVMPLNAPEIGAPMPTSGMPLNAPEFGAPMPTSGMPLNAPEIGAPMPTSGIPLNTSPLAAPRGAAARMSLNGDIIDTPSNQTPAPTTIGGAAGGRPSLPRPSYGVAPRKVEAARSPGRTATLVVSLLLILGLSGFGGWYYMMHRTNPKDQAQKAFAALKSQDWKAIYELTEQTDQAKSKYKDSQDFADQIKADLSKSPFGNVLGTLMSNMTLEAQEPKDNNGSTATVPVKMSMSLMGQSVTRNIDIKMKNFGGIWKISADNKSSLGGLGALSGGGFGAGSGAGQ